MNVIGAVKDAGSHWKEPAEGNYVSYKEAASLAFGHMGMRLARTFSLTQEDFVCNTLGMSQFQRVYMGYVTTALDLGKNLLNGYILDNRRSPEGRFRSYIKLGIPAGIILLAALFLVPFDRLAENNIWYMIAVSYGIGQVQGYISGWFNTGVCGLSQVITPNPKERTKVIAIEGLIHNIAPTITDIAVSMLLEKSYGFYDIRSFRIAYSPFIVIGTLMSLLSFYGVKERILLPKSRMTRPGFIDAFREVSKNRIFWIKMFDGWNDFLEDAKGNLLKYVYTYGKVADGASNVGLKYGLARDLVGSASFIAMIFTPSVIDRIGKGPYKFYKNIIQIGLICGMGYAYKRSVPLLVLFLWLDKIVDTASVIDSAIEADMKDYQHYLSGERIDGAFETVKLYMNTAVSAVTDLFVPWVKKKNGLTDNYDDLYDEAFRNRILDAMIKISVVGAVIDCVPYYFYNITESQMEGISRVLKLRNYAEEDAAGIAGERQRAECIEYIKAAEKTHRNGRLTITREGLKAARSHPKYDKERRSRSIAEAKAEIKNAKRHNREYEAGEVLIAELRRFRTDMGKAELALAEIIAAGAQTGYLKNAETAANFTETPEYAALSEKEKKEIGRKLSEIARAEKYARKYYPDGLRECDPAELDRAIAMPDGSRAEKCARRQAIRAAEKERGRYGRAAKPRLTAERTLILYNTYTKLTSGEEAKR